MRVFENAHPLEILRWAGEEYGDGLVVTASFGDAVLVHLVSRAIPDADVVLLDTGYLFAETQWYAEHLREAYGLNLRIVGPPEDAPRDLWQTDTDACCAVRKVDPLNRALEGMDAWISGLRRDQSPSRASTPKLAWDAKHGLWKANPLADWSEPDVWRYIVENDLPYNPLHDQGYSSIGCTHCTLPGAGRDGRWAGLEKSECGMHAPVAG